jgi:SAM-dependent methyltransferase
MTVVRPKVERYYEIIEHYESCLERYGDSHLGVDWPNAEDAELRHRIMLEVIPPAARSRRRVSLLDFGCGLSHLYEHIRRHGLAKIAYAGLDISPKFVSVARAKFPRNRYYCVDILRDRINLPHFDYVIMNGVFNEKRSLSFDEMFEYCQEVVRRVFSLARGGVAFNVMSHHVDWQRDDLFHVPFDKLAAFLKRDVSRHVVFRADYGLYEYTAFVYRAPQGREKRIDAGDAGANG